MTRIAAADGIGVGESCVPVNSGNNHCQTVNEPKEITQRGLSEFQKDSPHFEQHQNPFNEGRVDRLMMHSKSSEGWSKQAHMHWIQKSRRRYRHSLEDSATSWKRTSCEDFRDWKSNYCFDQEGIQAYFESRTLDMKRLLVHILNIRDGNMYRPYVDIMRTIDRAIPKSFFQPYSWDPTRMQDLDCSFVQQLPTSPQWFVSFPKQVLLSEILVGASFYCYLLIRPNPLCPPAFDSLQRYWESPGN